MSDTVIKVENLSKQYRLGLIGTGTLTHDLNRWWHKVRGKEDPYLKIGETNDRATKGKSDYVWALKDINFEVKQGEVLGIIGKNGAGKSTLLKLLSRVTTPTTGAIKTKGRIASLLEVGTGFHPELTGRDNIFLNGAILGMTKAEIKHKLDEIIDFSGTARYIDTPVKRYSSGMRVRLAFAVAAYLEPEILIVDEVLAVGDAEFQKKAIGKMQDVAKGGGRTVLFVSHNMAAVKNLCPRGLILKNGRIEDSGDINEIVSKYIENNSDFGSIKFLEKENKEYKIKIKGLSYKIDSNNSLVFTINIQSDQINKNIGVGLSLSTFENVRVASLAPSVTGFYVDEMHGEIDVNFCCREITSFLAGGEYLIDVWLSIPKVSYILYLKECFKITIPEVDIYKSGKYYNLSEHGVVPLYFEPYILNK